MPAYGLLRMPIVGVEISGSYVLPPLVPVRLEASGVRQMPNK
jgi:hypothetical protein